MKLEAKRWRETLQRRRQTSRRLTIAATVRYFTIRTDSLPSSPY
eukprot:COSAG01_NODE_34559_length_545_cov_1.950673_1_plen_43_part_10